MKLSFTVEGRRLGGDAPVFIIAEIGINHGGREERAAALVDAAADAGADAVKFQTVDADASYQPDTQSHRAFRDCALSLDAMVRLVARARERGMVPFSTPGDTGSLALMTAAGMELVKISSGQLNNVPLLRAAAATGLPLILSTGMADLQEVRAMVACAEAAGAHDIALLHCTSLYPAPADCLNLRAIATLQEAFAGPVGYSDHYVGHLAAVAAVAAGAKVVEKHFTLDRSETGADHAISADGRQMAALVGQIRDVEAMLGSPDKTPTAEEVALRPSRQRYLVTTRELAAGEPLASDMLLPMRILPVDGAIAAARYDEVIGRRIRQQVAANEPLLEASIEDLA